MGHPFTRQNALFFVAMLACCAPAQAVDLEAARALAGGRNSCLKCHDEGRDATPFKKIANKYRNDPQVEAKLIKHLTSNPEVTFLDGTKDEHKNVRTVPADDVAQIKNLIQWVLTH